MKLSVELFFENQGELQKINCDWFEGMQVQDVLKLAPVKLADNLTVGIFGKIVDPGQSVLPGDRIEIYSDLLIDPKEARRHRAVRKKT
jgi:putative ubiquitin-RnfH superfamily antitoxin RatB of RatAB toxin-antitoxin module